MTDALRLLRSAERPGFLFTGGSARCIFQVGAVEALASLGIHPAACLGVSAGSWNAAAVAVGNWRRLRSYWRFFGRMPSLDLGNLAREHSPFIWSRIHRRAYDRYVGTENVRACAIPILIGLTRLPERQRIVLDIRSAADPFRVLLASNFLRPFFTHPIVVDGHRYGDGGWSDNMPYEVLFEHGCDAVVILTMKGEREGGLYRSPDDVDHAIAPPYRDRVVVIRPRHRIPLSFVERRWSVLAPFADLGAFRVREVLLGECHPECDIAAKGRAPSAYISGLRNWLRRRRSRA
jgi:predicted acylesterase/phospholipase RssA